MLERNDFVSNVSTGQVMIVAEAGPDGTVTCDWYDKKTGEFHSDVFLLEEIQFLRKQKNP